MVDAIMNAARLANRRDRCIGILQRRLRAQKRPGGLQESFVFRSTTGRNLGDRSATEAVITTEHVAAAVTMLATRLVQSPAAARAWAAAVRPAGDIAAAVSPAFARLLQIPAARGRYRCRRDEGCQSEQAEGETFQGTPPGRSPPQSFGPRIETMSVHLPLLHDPSTTTGAVLTASALAGRPHPVPAHLPCDPHIYDLTRHQR